MCLKVFNGTANAGPGHFSDKMMECEWGNADKLAWLKVQLVGRAQKELSADAQADYTKMYKALLECFEPNNELFMAKFCMCCKKVWRMG